MINGERCTALDCAEFALNVDGGDRRAEAKYQVQLVLQIA